MGKQLTSSASAPGFRESVADARRERARDEILTVARAIVLEDGPSALTMNAVAKRLGVTKPAIYYYFDGRDALVATLALGALEAEADALVSATKGASDGLEAAERFVRACLDHHRQHLDDFRLVYAIAQMMLPQTDENVRARIPPITRRMYDTLERRLAEGQTVGLIADGVNPRTTAVALHLAAIGFVTMYSLTEARGDPMKQSFDALVEALIRPLRRGLGR